MAHTANAAADVRQIAAAAAVEINLAIALHPILVNGKSGHNARPSCLSTTLHDAHTFSGCQIAGVFA